MTRAKEALQPGAADEMENLVENQPIEEQAATSAESTQDQTATENVQEPAQTEPTEEQSTTENVQEPAQPEPTEGQFNRERSGTVQPEPTEGQSATENVQEPVQPEPTEGQSTTDNAQETPTAEATPIVTTAEDVETYSEALEELNSEQIESLPPEE